MYFRPFGFVLVHLTNSNVTFSLFVNIAFHGGKKCPNRTCRVNWNYFLISNFSLSASIKVHLLQTILNGCQWVPIKRYRRTFVLWAGKFKLFLAVVEWLMRQGRHNKSSELTSWPNTNKQIFCLKISSTCI